VGENKVFSTRLLNGFERGATITAEVPATRPGHRAFVGVLPPLIDKKITQWRVRKFEIPEQLVEEYFGEEDLVDSHFVRLETLEEVEKLLHEWKLGDVPFDFPWRNDWPL
jgi:hypothetical protein